MIIDSVITKNNEKINYKFNTIITTSKKNYINTNTGQIAQNNLSLIKNQNYEVKKILKYYNDYWYNNQNDGIIYIRMEDNSKLTGIYCNNALNGFSKVLFINKDNSKGELFNNNANGYGIYYFSRQGCAYEGFWENNYKCGTGVENWWYEAAYEAEFKNGKKMEQEHINGKIILFIHGLIIIFMGLVFLKIKIKKYKEFIKWVWGND